MPNRWYFTKNGRDCLGPFRSRQLCQLAAGGLLLPDDMVLKEGSQRWVRARSIQGLFPELSGAGASPDRGHAPNEAAGGLTSASPEENVRSQPPSSASDDPSDTGARYRAFGLALAVTGCLTLLALTVLLAASDSRAREPIARVIAVAPIVVIVAGGVVGLIVLITGSMTACPECKRWWARTYLGRKAVEQKKCYGLVTRYAHSSFSGRLSGLSSHSGSIHHTSHDGTVYSSGTTSWKERVPVVRTTYELGYECKHCQAQWVRYQVVEVEDFERA
jgi:hypothetical protein